MIRLHLLVVLISLILSQVQSSELKPFASDFDYFDSIIESTLNCFQPIPKLYTSVITVIEPVRSEQAPIALSVAFKTKYQCRRYTSADLDEEECATTEETNSTETATD